MARIAYCIVHQNVSAKNALYLALKEDNAYGGWTKNLTDAIQFARATDAQWYIDRHRVAKSMRVREVIVREDV